MPSVEVFNRVLQLLMRHYNGIVSGYAAQPPAVPGVGCPHNGLRRIDDAEMWAYGFSEGVRLNPSAWRALLHDPEGQRWYRPIGLLGEDAFSTDQDALTETPRSEAALAAEIESSLLRIHAFGCRCGRPSTSASGHNA